MDQDTRLDAIVRAVGRDRDLKEVAVDADISDARGFLRLARVRAHRWEAPDVEQLGALRMSVRTPSMDSLTVTLFPRPDDDAPILLMFFLLTGSKVICHFNLNTPFGDDPDFARTWLEPQAEIVARYPAFDGRNKVPEWIQPRMHDWSIYGLFPQDRADDLTSCTLAGLDRYVTTLGTERPAPSAQRRAQVAAHHAAFRDDIRTRDKAQSISAKFIGKDKARRIFHEVVT